MKKIMFLTVILCTVLGITNLKAQRLDEKHEEGKWVNVYVHVASVPVVLNTPYTNGFITGDIDSTLNMDIPCLAPFPQTYYVVRIFVPYDRNFYTEIQVDLTTKPLPGSGVACTSWYTGSYHDTNVIYYSSLTSDVYITVTSSGLWEIIYHSGIED